MLCWSSVVRPRPWLWVPSCLAFFPLPHLQFAIWQLANPNVYLKAEVGPSGSFYTPQNITVGGVEEGRGWAQEGSCRRRLCVLPMHAGFRVAAPPCPRSSSPSPSLRWTPTRRWRPSGAPPPTRPASTPPGTCATGGELGWVHGHGNASTHTCTVLPCSAACTSTTLLAWPALPSKVLAALPAMHCCWRVQWLASPMPSAPPALMCSVCSNLGYTYDDLEQQFEALHKGCSCLPFT